MPREIRVGFWGIGAMGKGMVRCVSRKPGMRIVSAIVPAGHGEGADLGRLAGLPEDMGVTCMADVGRALDEGKPDVVLHATASFVREVYPQITELLKRGINVISIAEEMSFPYIREPELARSLDELAKQNGATVLGTGINPGFVLDTLIIALTGICQDVRMIKAARINDLSPFGPTVMKTQGVGTTPEEFERGLEDGSIVGHVGFPESISLIARAVGWEIDEIRQSREPIISKTYRETPHARVEPGMVAGCRHTAMGLKKGEPLITLEHPQQILPHLDGVDTGDYIQIEGTPPVNLTIKPEIPGGTGTVAIACNMIPVVIDAPPGLATMADLPVPRAILGQWRKGD
ncbi:MAG: 2,4-diaminopentanoate dehydrogenase [Bacillota bacterium]